MPTPSLDATGSSRQLPWVPTTSSGAADESSTIRQLLERITRMEKDLMITHAGAAVMKKKGELAAQSDQYSQEELTKAT